MKATKKILQIISLIVVFTTCSLLFGVGSLFADTPSQNEVDEALANLDGLFTNMAKLDQNQAITKLLPTWQKITEILWNGRNGEESVLSDTQKNCLENIGLTDNTLNGIVVGFGEYIIDYSCPAGVNGWAGFVNAVNSQDSEYLTGLVGGGNGLYNWSGYSATTIHQISYPDFMKIFADLFQVRFAPGMQFTDDVEQQYAAIIQEIADKSGYDCLTTDDFAELFNQLTDTEKSDFESVLNTMGLINDENANPPAATTFVPENDAENVDLNTAVSATFDCDITSVDLSGITIKDGSTPIENVSASLAADNRTINITHDTLAYSTSYMVTIPAGAVKSVSGDMDNTQVNWSFTTVSDTTPPVNEDYILTVDADYDSENNKVYITGALKENNEEEQGVKDVSIGMVIEKGSQQIAFAQVITGNDGTFAKTFDTSLFGEGTYTVIATANLLTANVSFEIATTPANEKPQVVAFQPLNGASGVALTAAVSAKFDRDITVVDLSDVTIKADSTTVENVCASLAADKRTIDITHNSLAYRTTYTVTIPANSVKSVDGDMLNDAVTWSFTTKSSGGGGGGGSSTKPEVEKYEPEKNAEDVALDATVKLTFEQNILEVDLSKVYIEDSENNKVSGVSASISGDALTIAHDEFDNNTTYTVYVPADVLKSSNSYAHNNAISWSFTTIAITDTDTTSKCVFSDLPSNHWAYEVVGELCQKGIIGGYPDGTFKPDNNITRAEFAKIIVKAKGLSEIKPDQPTFSDVTPESWCYGVVEAAAKDSLIKGYGNGIFKPNVFIARQEIAAILARALGQEVEELCTSCMLSKLNNFKDNQQISAWATQSVAIAVEKGFITGYPDGTIGPNKNATRAETCAMVQRFLANQAE